MVHVHCLLPCTKAEDFLDTMSVSWLARSHGEE